MRPVNATAFKNLLRDLDGIQEVGLPSFCMGLTPNSCVRNGPGTAGLPITLGGVSVDAGDIVVGDRDGVVIIPQSRSTEIIEKLTAVRAAEAELEVQIRNGLYQIDSVRDLMNSDKTQYID